MKIRIIQIKNCKPLNQICICDITMRQEETGLTSEHKNHLSVCGFSNQQLMIASQTSQLPLHRSGTKQFCEKM